LATFEQAMTKTRPAAIGGRLSPGHGSPDELCEPWKLVDAVEAFLQESLHCLAVIDGLRCEPCLDELRFGGAPQIEHRRIEGERGHQQAERHHREAERLRSVPVACLDVAGIDHECDDDRQRDEERQPLCRLMS
jgi:hypothetical protein